MKIINISENNVEISASKINRRLMKWHNNEKQSKPWRQRKCENNGNGEKKIGESEMAAWHHVSKAAMAMAMKMA
jgi:hypothetical protein